jgi:hypothetical protein
MRIEILGHTILDTRERDEFGRLISQPLTKREEEAAAHLLKRVHHSLNKPGELPPSSPQRK